jgi:uncharacterized RDD family membrane protein YckC
MTQLPQAPLVDTIRTVETPEGVILELRLAGPISRASAWFMDFLLRTAAYWVVAMVTTAFGDLGEGGFLVFVFLAEWFYPVVFEVYRGGSTPGKRVSGLMVVHDDGTPVRLGASVLRNLLRVADFLPFGYLTGLVTMIADGEFRRLGDLAAGTVVVHRYPVPAGGTPVEAAPQPLSARLDAQEQRALVAFAERTRDWTPERAQELAGILLPLTGLQGEAAVRRLHAMAAWVMGRR